MCTVVILRRPDHDWPVLIGANRDEMKDRPWLAPARHWPNRDHVIAGRDTLADGTWMGVNDDGLVAAILNRPGSLGPADGLRSRGELPLEALDHAEAHIAAEALSRLEPQSYRTFNLLIADARDAFVVISAQLSDDPDDKQITVHPVPTGLSMISAQGMNTDDSARLRFYRPRFEEATIPNPQTGDWTQWQKLLASRDHEPDSGTEGAMNIATDIGFATVCSSVLALPGYQQEDRKPVWLFAAGDPETTNYEPVS